MLPIKIKLPENFLEEEERDGYKVSSEMKKVWAVLLDLLYEFQVVCDKNQIRWWVSDGTLLGAVRHKGIIPWDDDIDVMLMREDYVKLCRIAETEFKHPYFFQTEETDKGSARGHAQLRNSKTTGILKEELNSKRGINQGIFLDIFPLDSVPEDNILFSQQAKNISIFKRRTNLYLNLNQYYDYKSFKSFKGKIAAPILHLLTKIPFLNCFNYQIPYNKYLKEMEKYNNIETPQVGNLVIVPITKQVLSERIWFDNTIYMPFEFMTVPVPGGYEQYLETLYGDWHKFVIGTSCHGGCLFDAEKPYTEYLK